MAAGLEQQNQALESTYLARLQKQRALLPARVAVKLADYGWERPRARPRSRWAFVERLKASKIDGLDKPRAEWLPRLTEALTKLAAAVKARDAGVDAVGTARIAEEAAREDHELSVDKLVGEVRALYPKDRKRWEIIFPTVVRGSSRNDDPKPEPAP